MAPDFPERESLVCADGTRLSVGVIRPAGEVVGVALCGHAMMVNARSLDRPMGQGWASSLAAQGFLVLAADLRGHGRSGTPAARGGSWSYDELVQQDIPALVGFAHAQAPGKPLFVVGQSLMGHVTLAWLGQNPTAPVHAVVLLSANVWLDHGEPSLGNRLRRRRDLLLVDTLIRLFGYFPARRLRMGSDDEAAPYFRQLAGFSRAGGWRSATGMDYHAGLASLRCRLLAVVGKADRYWCNVDTARAFLAPVAAELVDMWHVGKGDRGLDFDPGHMTLVTDRRSAPVWQEIGRWMQAQIPEEP